MPRSRKRAPERKPVRLATSLTCVAPGAPLGCAGEVAEGEGLTLCNSHRVALAELTGPWRTPTGADEWREGMRNVLLARWNLGDGRVLLEEPSGPGRYKPPWVDWNDPAQRARMAESFFWIGGTPGWDSSDEKLRGVSYDELALDKPDKAQAGRAVKKTAKQKTAGKPGENARKFWHWKNFRRGKRRAG